MASTVLGEADEAESWVGSADLLQQLGRAVEGMIIGKNHLSLQRCQPLQERTQTRHQSWKHSLFVVNRDDDAEFVAAHRARTKTSFQCNGVSLQTGLHSRAYSVRIFAPMDHLQTRPPKG